MLVGSHYDMVQNNMISLTVTVLWQIEDWWHQKTESSLVQVMVSALVRLMACLWTGEKPFNGFSPVQSWAISQANADVLPMGLLWTNFSEIWIEI